MRLTSFENDGLRFDVSDSGPEDGPVVVLLHGFPERSSSWRDVAPLLHEHGLRTLAPDQRGYSPGARPTGRRAYALPRLAGDIAALIDQVGGPVHLVGHDWGASVGWYLAARRPEIVATYTAFSVPHLEAFTHALRGRQALKSWYMAFFNLPWLPERLAAAHVLDRLLLQAGMTRADLARFHTEILEYGALPGALGWYRALPLATRLGDLTVHLPTTMVWSDGDTAIDRSGVEETVKYCAGPYEYVELVGVTHWIPTQAPQAAADAILARIGES